MTATHTVATVTATGGDPAVVAAVFVGLTVSLALSVAIAYRLYRGYRRVGDPGMGRLAVGLVLLTTGPVVLRIVLPTLSTVPAATRSLAVSASELCGLLVILAVIYDAL